MLVDILYEIALHSNYKEVIQITSTSHYHYHYFKNIWVQMLNRDYPSLKPKFLSFKLNYIHANYANYFAIKTLNLLKKLQKRSHKYHIYIKLSRIVDQYSWLPKEFHDIINYDPSIEIKIDEHIHLDLFSYNDTEKYESVNVDHTIDYYLTLLFYNDPLVEFISYNQDVKKKLIINYDKRKLYHQKYLI